MWEWYGVDFHSDYHKIFRAEAAAFTRAEAALFFVTCKSAYVFFMIPLTIKIHINIVGHVVHRL